MLSANEYSLLYQKSEWELGNEDATEADILHLMNRKVTARIM